MSSYTVIALATESGVSGGYPTLVEATEAAINHQRGATLVAIRHRQPLVRFGVVDSNGRTYIRTAPTCDGCGGELFGMSADRLPSGAVLRKQPSGDVVLCPRCAAERLGMPLAGEAD